MKRRAIQVYGFRVCEPQHDGTPHWHLLLFMHPAHTEEVRAIMRHYALQIDGDEPGAEKHRFKSVAIDWSRGSAAGYIAKYIAKNTDGFGLNEDLRGQDPKKVAERVDAWASHAARGVALRYRDRRDPDYQYQLGGTGAEIAVGCQQMPIKVQVNDRGMLRIYRPNQPHFPYAAYR